MNQSWTEMGAGRGKRGGSQMFPVNSSGVNSQEQHAVWDRLVGAPGSARIQGGDRPHLLVGLGNTTCLTTWIAGQMC